MNLKISIAGICIEFISLFDFNMTEQFKPFQLNSKKSDIKVYFFEQDKLPIFSENPLYSSEIYKVYIDEESVKWRCFFANGKTDACYATCKVDVNQSASLILYKKEGMSRFINLNSAMYHIGWENHLLHFNRFIFHASCIETAFGGILFSGVSGIGKSTQADLWCRYEEAKLINGDRPIVGKADDQWKAFGSPYAGSSNCYVNASVSIKAIVFLGQGQNCSIKQLKGKAAFHKMLEQTTVNQWDQACMSKVCDLILELITVIPVYEMICTPDRDAVVCLKELLQEEGSQNAEE